MENVWDYPRPPRVEPSSRPVRVEHGGRVIATTDRALRVLETSHPPAIYLPVSAFAPGMLLPSGGRGSFCEFKGSATYLDVAGERRAGWTYPDPSPGYEALRDHVALYPGRFDACHLGDERVRAQEGDFYGGWITDDLQGPFKGPPGTMGW